MHERTGELNQTFEKTSVRAVPVRQPQMFEHIVRLVIQPAVETIEIAKVMRIEILSPEGFNHGGDARAFLTHRLKIKSKYQSQKSKVQFGNVAADSRQY